MDASAGGGIVMETVKKAGLEEALGQVAKVLAFGQQKYPSNDWNTYPPEKHLHAILRHLGRGDALDEETGLPHAAHAAARCMMLLGVLNAKR